MDPESFVRGGENLITFFFVDEGTEDRNTAINGPSSAHQTPLKWRFAGGLMMAQH